MRHLVLAVAALLLALPAAAQDFKVATTFTIIADMARQVAGDDAEVVSITRPGADIHGYQPTPRDILAAQDADLVLWNGLGLETWFEQFFRNLRGVPQAVVSDGIVPIPIEGGGYDGRPNPHGWMGLKPALRYVDNIAAAMAEHDPTNATGYLARAEAYKAEIAATIGPLREAIGALPKERRWLATSEGAFSYLARDMGLREAYLWPINADGQGTPGQVRDLIETVRAHDIPVVFSESTVPADAAEQVARETDAVYGGVLYVDSLSDAGGPVPSYLELLRVTTETILTGLADPADAER